MSTLHRTSISIRLCGDARKCPGGHRSIQTWTAITSVCRKREPTEKKQYVLPAAAASSPSPMDNPYTPSVSKGAYNTHNVNCI